MPQAGSASATSTHRPPSTAGTTSVPGALGQVPDFQDRGEVVAAVTTALTRCGAPWAWQGPLGALEKWLAETGASDLDIWWNPNQAQRSKAVRELVARLGGAVITESRDPRRLRHLSIAYQTPSGLALVDLTEGDLRVGPVLMVPAGEVTHDDHRLVGIAGAADLALRPVLRGRLPVPERLAQAREQWGTAGAREQDAAAQRWRAQLGSVGDEVVALLAGPYPPDPGLPKRARRALLGATLGPAALPAAWRARHSIVPAGRRAGPLGHRAHGVVVALVGTDGSGKSTVARNVAVRLAAAGMQTSEAYFGMAHGNLPGVATARRLLGVAAAGDRATGSDPDPGAVRPGTPAGPAVPVGPTEPAARADGTTGEGSAKPADHALARQLAAWFYALEYQWRYLRHVSGPRRRGRVVICDRYVYDLRDSPWPGSPAARLAEWVMPAPDLLVLPDAPAEMVHARKPERSLAEQAAQQAAFRRLLAERPARVGEVILDTSGATSAPEIGLVAMIIAAAHDPHRRRATGE